jgi:hypothetical protein
LLQLCIINIGWYRPGQPCLFCPAKILRDRWPCDVAHPGNLAIAELLDPFESKYFFDRTHGYSLGWHLISLGEQKEIKILAAGIPRR